MALKIADDQGTLHNVLQGWVHDGSKWRTIACSYVADSAGALKRDVDCIGTISLLGILPTWHSFLLTWKALGADTVDVYVNNVLQTTSTSENGSYKVEGLNPGASYTSYIVAHSPNQDVRSPNDTITLQAMPAPTGLSSSGQSNTSYTLSHSSVTAASRYDVYNADNNQAWASDANTSHARGGLSAGSSYRDYVKAVHSSGAQSGASDVLSSSTTAAFPAGTYDFYPTSANTWQGTAQTWKNPGTDAELWHGDGGTFGAAGGSRYAFFFGYRHSNGEGIAQYFDRYGNINVNVTGLQIRMARKNTSHGVNSAQQCRWWRHQHASQPSHPTTYGGASDNGTLTRGEDKWITIPTDWGADLMNGGSLGIIWGGYPYFSSGAGYMIAPYSINYNGCIGAIKITVG
jgi:hypothetical protein